MYETQESCKGLCGIIQTPLFTSRRRAVSDDFEQAMARSLLQLMMGVNAGSYVLKFFDTVKMQYAFEHMNTGSILYV